MQVTSTNIAKPTTFTWNGKTITTGIYKLPTDKPFFLGTYDVKNDSVIDRKNHGGEFKACYLFSEDHYDYWKKLYPNLDWNWGMFGENLTVSGLNEDKIYIGDVYKVGKALVQVTQPREPCFKFGYKFGSQEVIKQFIDYGYPGTYVRVLEEGYVREGDKFKLIKQAENSITTVEFFNLFFSKNKNKTLIKAIINNNSLPQRKRDKLKTFLY
ncbi:MOSC domain-containing protein [Seonamhaeicola sediminis]|uniref:MOSC domain-containing protein n=1 Tax=Seonamhaeicola sediminis TaxID=2528206 RepID=A0A562YC76_9FLAO|nr:MOSC domain-containing protein [Seonamhaeicola sediminis]TWO31681.1 MOSC domain-containing protein [Seonamhaeicola sediminis]